MRPQQLENTKTQQTRRKKDTRVHYTKLKKQPTPTPRTPKPKREGRTKENQPHTNNGGPFPQDPTAHPNKPEPKKTHTTPPTHIGRGGCIHLRKEVIQPHLPVRLPCYDFVLIASPTFDHSPPKRVGPWASGVTDFHDVTGGVYKARERIHRSNADLRLLATPTS
jgi:hypothetical protein